MTSAIVNQHAPMIEPHHLPAFDAVFPVVRRAALRKRVGRRLVQVATGLAAMPAQIGYWRVLRMARAAGVLSDPFDIRKPWPIAAKHLGCYLSPAFSTADRLAVLQRTYEVLAARTRALPYLDLPHRRRIWTCASEAIDLAVWIGPPTSTPMEGELALVFTAQGTTIYTLTLAIAPGSLVGMRDADVIVIGGLQGAIGSRLAIREAAKAVGEVAPQDVLLLAARALAQRLEIETIVGLGSTLHVSRHAGEISSAGLDYDDLWTRKDATRTARGFFVLPQMNSVSAKSDQGSSAHRSRARRKRELKVGLQNEIGSGLRACFAARSEMSLRRDAVSVGEQRLGRCYRPATS